MDPFSSVDKQLQGLEQSCAWLALGSWGTAAPADLLGSWRSKWVWPAQVLTGLPGSEQWLGESG